MFNDLKGNVEIVEVSEPAQLRDALQGINTLFLANNFLKEISLRKELRVIDIARKSDIRHIVRVCFFIVFSLFILNCSLLLNLEILIELQ